MSQIEVAPQVALEDDTLSVTVERQVASFGDHTTVRAHVSTKITPPGDESVTEYQDRLAGAIAQLATPLKVAVLTEIGRSYSIVDGVVLEDVDVQTEGEAVAKVLEFRPQGAESEETVVRFPVKEWREQGGRNTLVPVSGPAWVQVEASNYDWATEVIHGYRKDGKGDYYQVSDGQKGGKRQFINQPRRTNTEASAEFDNEPF